MSTHNGESSLTSDKRENLRQLGWPVAVSGARVLLGLIAIMAFAFALWSGFAAFVQSTTAVTDAEIISQQENIVFGRADNWARLFEVTYRYRAADDPNPTTASHNVDPEVFERLRVGDAVRVHYSRYAMLRNIEGMGSYIEGTSAISRLNHGFSNRDLLLFSALLLFALAGLGAFALGSRVLGLLSLMLLGIFSPDTMLAFFALVVFPMLFWASRKKPAQGYGWLLVAASAGAMAVTCWRVPRPEPLPDGPQGSTRALVNRVKLVTNIWDVSSPGAASGRGRSGQNIRTPFYLLDLQFKPEGKVAPFHAVDRIDISGLPGLQKGTFVEVIYSLSDPHAAQVAGASRTFSHAIFTYIAFLTFCSTAVITFVAIPVLGLVKSMWRKLALPQVHQHPILFSTITDKSNPERRAAKD